MSERVLGTTFSFRTVGMPEVQRGVKGFTQMSGAIDNFTAKTMKLGASGAGIAAFGYAVTKPLTRLRQSFIQTGAFFEDMMVRFDAMAKQTGTTAKEMFNFVSAAAYEIPFAFEEALEVTQQFNMMGVKLNKTYGSVMRLGEEIPITYANAMSGLAAKSGATFTQIAHHIRSAIQAGRADYLQYWIGPLETQMMKMSGVFIGTFQDQFDKTMQWLGPRYAKYASQMSENLQATLIGFSDLKKRLISDLAGIGAEDEKGRPLRGAFWGMKMGLAVTLRELTHFFYATTTAMPKALGYGAKLGDVLRDIFLPLSSGFIAEGPGGEFELVGMLKKVMDTFKTFIDWIVAGRNRQAIIMLSRMTVYVGYIAIAFGTWLTVMKLIIPLLGLFVSMSAPFVVSFGLIASAALMAINILRTEWSHGAFSFVKVLDWLKEKLMVAASFMQVAFQIMLGAGTHQQGVGAWVSMSAWNALSEGQQSFLVKFMNKWLWLKEKLIGVFKGIKANWGNVKDFFVGTFEFLAKKLKWMVEHWKTTLALFAAAWIGKKIVGGIWSFLFGSSPKEGKGGGGGGLGIPVFVTNFADFGGGGGAKEGGSRGIVGWIWHIFKTISMAAFFGFGHGLYKIFKFLKFPLIAKYVGTLGLWGAATFKWILNFFVGLGKVVFLGLKWILAPLIAGIAGWFIGKGINWLIDNTAIGKFLYKMTPLGQATSMVERAGDRQNRGLMAQKVNLEALNAAVLAKQITPQEHREGVMKSMNPTFNANIYIQDPSTGGVAAEETQKSFEEMYRNLMDEIKYGRLGSGERLGA